MFREYDFRKYDFMLIVFVVILIVIGIVAIGSAIGINLDYGSDQDYKKQIMGAIIGIVAMLIISMLDYHFTTKFYWVIYLFNILLLVAVLFVGVEVKGATRWIELGGIRVQPSEFCKLFMILFLAKFLDKNQSNINKPWFLMLLATLIGIPVFLVYKENDLSTSIVIIFIMIMMVFVSGLSYKYVVTALAIGLPLFLFTTWYVQQPDQKLLKEYQVKRVVETSTQTKASIQAIGSGQLYGKGLYEGKLHQYNYLPEPETDFIFSIIGEEFGFIGCSTILGCILLFLLNCIWIAKDAKDLCGVLIISGYVMMIGFQTFINVGVVTGVLPNTGVTLPFVSYGLSSLITNLMGLGFILNISMQRKSLYN